MQQQSLVRIDLELKYLTEMQTSNAIALQTAKFNLNYYSNAIKDIARERNSYVHYQASLEIVYKRWLHMQKYKTLYLLAYATVIASCGFGYAFGLYKFVTFVSSGLLVSLDLVTFILVTIVAIWALIFLLAALVKFLHQYLLDFDDSEHTSQSDSLHYFEALCKTALCVWFAPVACPYYMYFILCVNFFERRLKTMQDYIRAIDLRTLVDSVENM